MIKMETLRKPLFFAAKNCDSPFGEYITFSKGEWKPLGLRGRRCSLGCWHPPLLHSIINRFAPKGE